MPGIGKTTSIHCLAHQLLGDAYKEGVLELNASDERYLLYFICFECKLTKCEFPEASMLCETRSSLLHKRRLLFHPADTKLSS
jgi:hypothetical protein